MMNEDVHLIETMRLEQKGHHSANDILKAFSSMKIFIF